MQAEERVIFKGYVFLTNGKYLFCAAVSSYYGCSVDIA